LADIFVSYAREDKNKVAPLVKALEGQGWSVWWDPEITPGDDFEALISQELGNARSVIVVWTPNSVGSRWVKGEARDAADRGVLAPVRFGDATLPIDFRAIHTTDLDAWLDDQEDEAFSSLCKSLTVKMAKTPRRGTSSSANGDARPKISICVLPFANMSGDPEQEYFSDGVTEDIITDLSKVAALSVVSRNTAFSFKGEAIDVPQVAQKTNVSHVLEGSVRKAGNRVRITAQLIDATGRQRAQGWESCPDHGAVDRCQQRRPPLG
jgi:adenylate cyclase